MRARTRIRAIVGAATIGLVAALAVALPSAQLSAQAADLRAFDPGFIISDALFYDSGAMSTSAIQSFLNLQGSNCVATTGNTCLKDFRQTTADRPADTRCTGAYQGTGAGGGTESAAQIIAKVAVACGINPQTLLVMLQKEQGLVTATAGKGVSAYQIAMGYGCPDTAACNTLYYGFFNQLYSAAHQLRNYAMSPLSYGHRVGLVNQVRFHPNVACGTSAIMIKNQATASLYNYTPYQPNPPALAAGYGLGDACSSYGNRNFWNYFTDWFGPTTQRLAVGYLDAAISRSAGLITVSGWAVDVDTADPIAVHVYVDGHATKALIADAPRADVGRAYRRGDNHGFNGLVPASNGTHSVCVYAIDSAGGKNPIIGCATVKVVNHVPTGSLDAVTSAQGRITAVGWALDPDTTSPIAVHVYVDGKAAQAFTADGSRPDVGRIFGKGDSHGFGGTLDAVAGTHQVCVYAIDATGGANPIIGCKSVTVTNAAPTGALDVLTSGMESVTVHGWALDPDTTGAITVDVYVDGKATKTLLAASARSDIGRIYGKGENHGYSGTMDASYGKNDVCVYAIDSWVGSNRSVGCSSVDVNGTAVGGFDTAVGATGKITLTGWALDPNTNAPIAVHVYAYGEGAQALTAGLARPDIGRIYGQGDNHGFKGSVNALAGTHPVCVYAIDSWKGTNPLVGCRSVTVA